MYHMCTADGCGMLSKMLCPKESCVGQSSVPTQAAMSWKACTDCCHPKMNCGCPYVEAAAGENEMSCVTLGSNTSGATNKLILV